MSSITTVVDEQIYRENGDTCYRRQKLKIDVLNDVSKTNTDGEISMNWTKTSTFFAHHWSVCSLIGERMRNRMTGAFCERSSALRERRRLLRSDVHQTRPF